jgi:beta-mannosidase
MGRDTDDDSADVVLDRGWQWECASTQPGTASDPEDLDRAEIEWIPARVPGTAAGALRDHGAWTWGVADTEILDGRDWWFRGRFPDPGAGPWLLRLHGLATIADAWLNGSHLLHSDNMFLEHECAVDRLQADNDLCLRFAALSPVLAGRRTRPRWKSRLARSPNLRWIRTTLFGRMEGWSAWAAPVGPWRPVELISRGRAPRVEASTVAARCSGTGGTVSVHASLAIAGDPPTAASVRVGDLTAPLECSSDGERITVDGTILLADIERWWPHTHGAQPRYVVELEIDGTRIELATVGFRTVEVDRRDDGFTFVVNDTPIFCRGAVWVPPDVVSFAAPPDQVRASLELLRDAGMNMVRVAGHSAYESPEFWDLCDELGVMVWQDCMLASSDPPDDEAFTHAVETEVAQVLTRLQGRPALALVCGSSETYQQAAMNGLEPGSWTSALLEDAIRGVVERTLPGVAYLASSPIGGELPFDPSVGASHYFGVGAYRRPLSDARASGVRFASECLAFSIPPERASVDEMFGGSRDAGHTATWKAGIARDSATSWDFEDVRDFYVRDLYGCDPAEIRFADPDRALDLGRAAVADVMAEVMGEWRRPGSRCAGGLVLSWQDLWPGAGWGIIDALGRPKAPWYALRRALEPCTVLMTDEGLSGLRVHVVNDLASAFSGRLELAAYADDGVRIEHAVESIEAGAHSALTFTASGLLGGFRDLTRAYRFGPPSHDVVVATLTSAGDGSERQAFFLPLGRRRPRLPELGLTASARRRAGGDWGLTIASRLFAQFVVVDVPGYAPSDSWFHLAPGVARTIGLRAEGTDRAPSGDVRALNSPASARIRFEDEG